MDRPLVAHDHVVLLLDQKDFECPPDWLAKNFHIIEGGVHTGGSSRNKLIIFEDGTYLELFNWITDPVEFLDWAGKRPGLIDFALTTHSPSTAQQNFVAISLALEANRQESLGAAYDHPRSGGRKRKDGIEIQWETTRPLFHDGPGLPESVYFPSKRLDIPFFCHDITQRIARVPSRDASMTTHPCGAIGISSVEVLVPSAQMHHYVQLYKTILGVGEKATFDKLGLAGAEFAITTPVSKQSRSSILLRSLREASVGPDMEKVEDSAHRRRNHDEAWLLERGIGIRSLTVQVPGSRHTGLDKTALASSGIGFTILIEDLPNQVEVV